MLDNLPRCHDQHFVGVHNGLQSMRDHKQCCRLELLGEYGLDLCVNLR